MNYFYEAWFNLLLCLWQDVHKLLNGMDSKYLLLLLLVFIVLTTNRCTARKSFRPIKIVRIRRFRTLRRGIGARCFPTNTRRCKCYYWGRATCFKVCSDSPRRICAVG